MLRGTNGLMAPVRDTQQDEPACYCERCGGEVFSGETVYTWQDKKICSDCFKSVVTAWLEDAPNEVAAALETEMEEV